MSADDPLRSGEAGNPLLETEAPYRRALVIGNPVAGRGRGGKAAEEVAEGLRRMGVKVELLLTHERGDALARLRCLEPGTDLVVSVGGDGTLHEVFGGLIDPEIPVGILPLGTANVLATEVGLPRDVHRALEIFAAKNVVAIDVARVNGHLSFLVTGVGIDAMATRKVEQRRKGPITKWAYVEAVLLALKDYKVPRLEVEVDGERVEGEFGLVLVSNTINYGGILKMAQDTRMDDGLFEVYLFPGGSRRDLFAYALRGFLSRLPGGGCEMRRARSVKVRSESPVPYQVDGDYRGETPVEIEVADEQYHILVP